MNRGESFFKTVCAIAIPVTLQTMLQSSFSIVDQIMIGQLGSSNVAGVGMAGKFTSIYSVVISAIGAVAGIMISQYLGKHDHEEVRRSFLINLFFGFGIAGLFTVLCFMFARPIMAFYTTRLVLKAPKTESSVRRIWLPKTLAYILRKWQDSQNELKEFLGDEYQDYDLVVAQKNGRPCDGRVIEKEFERLKKKAELPNVVFHSLRHSSTTYKLKLNHGDLKATQGDTGHAEIEMITKVYAHILDEDRKINAQKFDSAFYSNPDLRQVKAPQVQGMSAEQLLAQLKESPELANALAQLLASGKAG